MYSIQTRAETQGSSVLFDELKTELYYQFNIANTSHERIQSWMLMCNSIAYCVGLNYGVLKKSVNGGRSLIVENIPSLLQDIEANNISVEIAISHWHDYGNHHWHGVPNSLPYLRKQRSYFERQGLFTFEKQLPGSTRKPPVLKQVDFRKILALYEVCEAHLVQEGYELDDIGVYTDKEGNTRSHKGAIMKTLKEAIFQTAYNRKSEIEVLVEAIAEVPEAVWEDIEKQWEREQLLLMYGDLEPPY